MMVCVNYRDAQGHTMGAALTGALGSDSGGNSEVQQPSSSVSQPAIGSHTGSLDDSSTSACRFELKQFIECSQTQHDISLCQGFNEALKECRRANGE